MTNTRTGIILLVLAHGLAACSGSPSSAPAGPTAPSTIPQAGFSYPTNPTLIGVTLFGVVSETTPTGPQPIEGVDVYCDSCGEFGHTWAKTDAHRFYSFNGDLARGGGVWVQAGFTSPLIVTKQGYQDPTGLPVPTWPSPTPAGWREVPINGDTQFNIQLVRR